MNKRSAPGHALARSCSAPSRVRHHQRSDGLDGLHAFEELTAPARHAAHDWSNQAGKPIAVVLDVELEALCRKDRRTSHVTGMPTRERNCRTLEKKDTAAHAVALAGNPKAVRVTADEKCRYSFIEDIWIDWFDGRHDGLHIRLAPLSGVKA